MSFAKGYVVVWLFDCDVGRLAGVAIHMGTLIAHKSPLESCVGGGDWT